MLREKVGVEPFITVNIIVKSFFTLEVRAELMDSLDVLGRVLVVVGIHYKAFGPRFFPPFSLRLGDVVQDKEITMKEFVVLDATTVAYEDFPYYALE